MPKTNAPVVDLNEKVAAFITEIRGDLPKLKLKELQTVISEHFKKLESEKAKTPYQQFLSDKLKELARDNPDMKPSDRMALAQKAWSEAPKPPPAEVVEKKLNAYQQFSKDMNAALKVEKPGLSLEERREIISLRWAEHKAKQTADVVVAGVGAGAVAEGEGKGEDPKPAAVKKAAPAVKKKVGKAKKVPEEDLKEEEY